MSILEKVLRAGEGRMVRRLKAIAEAVNSIEDDYVDLTDDELRECTQQFKERVEEVLAKEVGPALGLEGASVEVLDVTDGVVRVRFHGGCGGCPSTVIALVMGIEQELRRLLPEVQYLEAVP